MIAETKDVKSLRFDHYGARGVPLLGLIGEVLPAIELDDEPRSMTDKVSDVAFDRDLPPKAGSGQAMIAQLRPKDALGVGGIPTERPCV